MNNKTLVLSAFFAMTSTSIIAADNKTTICTHGDAERKIEVVYPNGTETPCEVQYTKKGEMKVLWSATAELGYCEEKAAAFVEKQQGWGWNCFSPEASDVEVEEKEIAEDKLDSTAS